MSTKKLQLIGDSLSIELSDEQISEAINEYFTEHPVSDGKDYVLTEEDKQEIAGMVNVEGDAGIDDTEPSPNTTYSSSKIDALLNEQKEAIDSLATSGVTLAQVSTLGDIVHSIAYWVGADAQEKLAAFDTAWGYGALSITNNLSNVINSNSATRTDVGRSYYAVLTAETGYELDAVSVVMADADVTAEVYADGIINIASVTGNIVITAVAAAAAGVVTYSVTNNMTNANTSNAANSVAQGNSYYAVITPASGYNSVNVTVTMGGVDVTATAFSGNAINIASVTGDIVITATGVATTYYSVTYNLTDVTSDNKETSVKAGSAYSAVLSVADGYQLGSVTVTMGGTDVTSTAVSGKSISIGSVTGDIVITAAAQGNTYVVETAWTPGEISSSGSYDPSTGTGLINSNSEVGAYRTEFIDCVKGQTITVTNTNPEWTNKYIKSDGSSQVWCAAMFCHINENSGKYGYIYPRQVFEQESSSISFTATSDNTDKVVVCISNLAGGYADTAVVTMTRV